MNYSGHLRLWHWQLGDWGLCRWPHSLSLWLQTRSWTRFPLALVLQLRPGWETCSGRETQEVPPVRHTHPRFSALLPARLCWSCCSAWKMCMQRYSVTISRLSSWLARSCLTWHCSKLQTGWMGAAGVPCGGWGGSIRVRRWTLSAIISVCGSPRPPSLLSLLLTM